MKYHLHDVIFGDYLELSFTKVDVIIFQPPYAEVDKSEKFNIFTHIYPNIKDFIVKAIKETNNIILVLPALVDIQELGNLFGLAFA